MMSGAADREKMGQYSQRSIVPVGTVVLYLFMVLLLLLLWHLKAIPENVSLLLIAVLLIYLTRFLTLHYTLTDNTIGASRLFGSRIESLRSVRKAEFASLHDLSPVSYLGGWGWRSRMWSPIIGHFDNLSTVHHGLLVYAGDVPFFISPEDREAFFIELDKRCGGILRQG